MHPSRISSQPAFEDTLVKGTAQTFGVILRWWEDVQPPALNGNEKPTLIRFCSYNVLCQNTIGRSMHIYKHTSFDPSVLDWEQRWRGLAENLEKINADIFALQEVQESHFWSHFSPLMRQRGYGAHYQRKESPQVDGCALFYRTNMFEGISARSVRYFLAENTTLNKPQVVRLRCKTTNKQFLVANTHILWNIRRGDIKMAQVATLLANIDKELKDNGKAPFVILGDFNIDPSSPIYKFMTSSELCFDGLRRNILGFRGKPVGPFVNASQIIPSEAGIGLGCKFISENDPPVSFEKNAITHPFLLRSAYTYKSTKKGDYISIYNDDFGNPDFIFYSGITSGQSDVDENAAKHQPLRLIRRMSLPTLKQLKTTLGPWPNRYVPSDHIPLVCDFQLH